MTGDGVSAILDLQPSDLHLTDKRQFVAILQKGARTQVDIFR